ncbi:hypothetical protein XELAEV_18012122mg [Xenopus laevis]|uniref:ZP domain-containing protein n=1 Tax=Xenopus laevis TaxID=8355 RepID=A0A974DNY0_XENLA|nr:hypothetical protein XELAEV_18012122mg [Xenopus laevis]
MVLRIPRCQMEKNGYNSSSLSLIMPTCRLTQPYPADVSTLSYLWLRECGNIRTENATHVTYNNTLNITPKKSALIIKNNININFSCSYPKNMDPTALNFPVKSITGSNSASLPGQSGKISVTMAIYTDPSFTIPVTTSTTLVVEQKIYVSVLMQTVDSYVLKVVNLYTSASSNRSADPKYYLLQNSCPNLSLGAFLLTTIWNGPYTEARFEMKDFQISGSSFYYLYADVAMCNSSCTQVKPFTLSATPYD